MHVGFITGQPENCRTYILSGGNAWCTRSCIALPSAKNDTTRNASADIPVQEGIHRLKAGAIGASFDGRLNGLAEKKCLIVAVGLIPKRGRQRFRICEHLSERDSRLRRVKGKDEIEIRYLVNQ